MAHDDDRFMARALRLAARGRGTTHPNPMVGAVVVKSGQVVGEGWHSRPGEKHAEDAALAAAGPAAAGSTLYVNLEPCCHHGKTPPCTEAILKAGVKRVVIGCTDRDTRVAGKGEAALRESGVAVFTGVAEKKAKELNRAYLHYAATDSPYVTLKLAVTLDGRIATSSGQSKWITGRESRKQAHLLRGVVDGVLTGVGTVLADDPLLTARAPGVKVQPERIILDPALRTPVDARLVDEAVDGKTVLVVGKSVPESRMAPYLDSGVRFLKLSTRQGTFSWNDLRSGLVSENVIHLLVEGGSFTAAWFIREGAVSRVELYYAPSLLGSDSLPAVGELLVDDLRHAPRFDMVSCRRTGSDLHMILDVL